MALANSTEDDDFLAIETAVHVDPEGGVHVDPEGGSLPAREGRGQTPGHHCRTTSAVRWLATTLLRCGGLLVHHCFGFLAWHVASESRVTASGFCRAKRKRK